MDSRGIYTATVAILIIAIIGGTMLYFNKPSIETQAETTARSVREVKMYWENARIVMDKAVSVALVEAAKEKIESNCNKDRCEKQAITGLNSKYISKAEAAFADMKDKIDGTGVICTIDKLHPIGPTDALDGKYYGTSMKLSCEKKADNYFSARYNSTGGQGNDIVFGKRIAATYQALLPGVSGTPMCKIEVFDTQSGQRDYGESAQCGGTVVPPKKCEVTVSEKKPPKAGYDARFEAKYWNATWGSWSNWENKGSGTVFCEQILTFSETGGVTSQYLECTCSEATQIEATAAVSCNDDSSTPSIMQSHTATIDCAPKIDTCVVGVMDGGATGAIGTKGVAATIDGLGPAKATKINAYYNCGMNSEYAECQDIDGSGLNWSCPCEKGGYQFCGFGIGINPSDYANCGKAYYAIGEGEHGYNVTPC
ncbi:hypothetical protein KJ891_02765 [Candidatus Micrarchaeota archaeon]|nr:hypothetical protein [Candidatus Micrarchaeota archaeon]